MIVPRLLLNVLVMSLNDFCLHQMYPSVDAPFRQNSDLLQMKITCCLCFVFLYPHLNQPVCQIQLSDSYTRWSHSCHNGPNTIHVHYMYKWCVLYQSITRSASEQYLSLFIPKYLVVYNVYLDHRVPPHQLPFTYSTGA